MSYLVDGFQILMTTIIILATTIIIQIIIIPMMSLSSIVLLLLLTVIDANEESNFDEPYFGTIAVKLHNRLLTNISITNVIMTIVYIHRMDYL